MTQFKILDCTLRDGGYCNQWKFGGDNIVKILAKLLDAKIDIIECGFLTDKKVHTFDNTNFNSIAEIAEVLPDNRAGSIYVCMVNYGEFDISNLPDCDHSSVDGIRLAFHKKDLVEALNIGKRIKEKGYLLFLQPMVSLNYADEDFLNLIRKSNEVHPDVFYIVDSFGAMKRSDLTRFFYLVEHNLDKDISIGFHSHNNMQLAFSNAQSLVDARSVHDIVVDSCVYGMGRGAGNLNTELFVSYLNENIGSTYKLAPLLSIIDEVLDDFYKCNYWGYSLPNYLSASHNTHPNYAGYLSDKRTLTVEEINEIFDMMDDEKRVYYDKTYIEDLYLRYLSRGDLKNEKSSELEKLIKGKKILLKAPGTSAKEEKEKIISFANNNDTIVISINFEYLFYEPNFIFMSNIRRFKEFSKEKYEKCIVTSNISADKVYLQTDYTELLNTYDMVQDNAGMMAIKFFIKYGAKEVWLAGLDGYSHDAMKNYGDDKMSFVAKNAVIDAINKGISGALTEFSREAKIYFLTSPKYVQMELK